MNSKKFFVLFIPRKNFWWMLGCLIFVIMSLAVGYLILIGLSAAFLLVLFVYYFIKRDGVKVDFEKYIEELSSDMGNTAQTAVDMISIPIAVVTLKGHIVWKNGFFTKQFSEKDMEQNCIKEVLAKIANQKIESEKFNLNIQLDTSSKNYKVTGKMIKKFAGTEDNFLLLYFSDNTETQKYKNKSIDEKTIVSIIVIDNYDELMQSMEDGKRPQMLAEIDAKLLAWANFTNGIIKKFERDKYIFIFENQFFKRFEEKKFDILEIVKEISLGNKIPVTISIGMDNTGEALNKSFQYAVTAIEIALGRGGDQVVIKSGDNIQFYGGNTKEVEKRTRVKARVIAHALRGIVARSKQIIIMGHTNCDVDALGSAIGVYKIALCMGKKAHIVMSGLNPTIEPFMQKITASNKYEGVFIDKTQALDIITKDTLLVVVDTHRPIYTECPELLKMTHNIVVIDHHRRGADFIQDIVLAYQEPYASSTCELVTEIIQYIEEFVKLDMIDAELLYAGIVVDTKSFTFKTGVRTFEAAAYLRKIGVDTIHIKQLLQNDLKSFISISNIVKDVEIVHSNIAISKCCAGLKNSPLIVAQAADQILSIAGIRAAFVISETGNGIFISGRSLGEVNVQIVLEKIGGGGHQSVAGAQFYNEEMESVINKLNGAIEEYLKEVSKEV